MNPKPSTPWDDDPAQEWGAATETENALRSLGAMGNNQLASEAKTATMNRRPTPGPAPAPKLLSIVDPSAPVTYVDESEPYDPRNDPGLEDLYPTDRQREDQLGRIGDAAGVLGNTVLNIGRRAWDSATHIPEALNKYGAEIKDNPLDYTSLTPRGLKSTAETAMAVAAPVAAIFSPAMDLGRRAVVDADPTLAALAKERISGLGDKSKDPMAQSDAYNQVFDDAKNALGEVANDPNATTGDRLAAGIVAGLMQTQEIAEFGGPSMIKGGLAWLRKASPKVAAQSGLADDLVVAPDSVAPLSQQVIDVLNQTPTQNLGATATASIEKARRSAIRTALRWAEDVDRADPAAVAKAGRSGKSLLNHIDEMIDTIQAEEARGMPRPDLFLDELLDARNAISTQVQTAENARKAALADFRVARKAESEASSGLRKAAATEERATRKVTDATADELKADIQGRSATAAAEAKAGERVNIAEGKVEKSADKMAAVEQTEQDVLRQIKAESEQKIADLRVKADDTTLSAMERESARVERNQMELDARRAALNEQKASSADRVSFRGTDAPETGYISPDDLELWDKTNIHIGKQESALVGEEIANAVRRAEASGRDIRKQRMTLEDISANVTRKYGEQSADELIDKVHKDLKDSPTKGEQATLYQAADDAIVHLTDNTRMAMKGGDSEDYANAAARLLQFIDDFRDAVGETGRALSSRRMVNRNSSSELVQGTNNLRASKAALGNAEKGLAKVEADAQKFSEGSAKRTAAIEEQAAKRDVLVGEREAAIRESVQAKEDAVRLRSEKRVEALDKQIAQVDALKAKLDAENAVLSATWDARVAEATSKVDEALAARAKAQEEVSAAARKMQETVIQRRAAELKRELTAEEVKVILQLDPENVAGFVRALRDRTIRKKGEIANTYVLTNMFGGAGQLANTIGNTVSLATTELLTRPVARAMSRVGPYRVDIKGNPAVAGGGPLGLGETKAALASAGSALRDAGQFALRTMIEGEDVATAARRGLLEITTPGASALGVSGRPVISGAKGLLLEWPRRMLTAMDGFFRILGTSGEAGAMVYRRAYNSAGGGKAGDKAGAKAVADFKTNPNIRDLEAANEYSGRLTFNEATVPGSPTSHIVKLVNVEVGNTGLRPGTWLVPVVRFGLNAATASARLSGGGLISGARSASRARDAAAVGKDAEALLLGRRAAQEAAQGIIGVSMLAGGWQMMDSGIMTGARPTAPKDIAQWEKDGKQPMSIKIAGRWVPLSLLGPPAAPLVLAALMMDQGDPTKDDDRIARASQGLAQFATDIPAVSGFYDLLDAANQLARNGPGAAWEKYATRVGQRFAYMSSTARALTNLTDGTVKDPENFIQSLMAIYPGFSGQVPEKIDPYTGDAVRKSTQGLAEVKGQSQDATYNELREQGHLLTGGGPTLGSVGGETVKLTNSEQHAYDVLVGKERKRTFDDLVASPSYQSVKDPLQRQAMLNSADTKATDRAQNVLARQMVDQAKTPQELTRALGVLITQGGTQGDRALTLAEYAGKVTPQIAAEIDAKRKPDKDGVLPPSVSDYLKAAPLVQQYLDIPAYRVGDEAQWQTYTVAKTLRTKITADWKRDHEGKEPTATQLRQAMEKVDPNARAVLIKYDAIDSHPERTKLLTKNSWLAPYVSSFKNTSKR